MKKTILSLIGALLLLSGCVDRFSNELELLERRLATLEAMVGDYNDNLESLRSVAQALLDNNDFVSSVTPVYGSDGEIVSYRIVFDKSGSVTLRNGAQGIDPQLCFKRGEDGLYYWAISYGDGAAEFITIDDTGQRVSATAVTPQVKIEEGNWYVSYDYGGSWSFIGKATGVSGTAFVSSVTQNDSYITMKFVDGTTVLFPTLEFFELMRNTVRSVNSNLETMVELHEAMERKAWAKDIIPISDGTKTIGYRILFSDGTTLPVYNATTGMLPRLGAAKGDDGYYYWTVLYRGDDAPSWLLCNGERVRAESKTSMVPQMGIARNEAGAYCWTVSYDGGTSSEWLLHEGNPLEVQLTVPENPVSALQEVSSQYYLITLNGEEIYLPRYRDLGIEIERQVQMGAGMTTSLVYYIAEADDTTEFLALVENRGFTVRIEKINLTRGYLVIESPDTFTEGSTQVSLLVSDGNGTLNTVVITVNYGG